MDLVPIRPGDKALVLGQNGTGKSLWAHAVALAWSAGTVLVVDTKGDDPAAELPNQTVATRAEDVVRRLPGRVLYRPSLAEKSVRRVGDPPNLRPLWARFETVARKVWEQAQVTRAPQLVVIHELAELCTSAAIGPAFRELITSGRSWGITLVLLTQRPQGVAVIARSEAQHVVCFALADQDSRDMASRLLDDIYAPELASFVRARSLPRDFSWWYRGPDYRLARHTAIAAPGPRRGGNDAPAPLSPRPR